MKYNESHIGIKAILLMNKLGYEVVIPKHLESGRTYLSKGLLRKAKQIANFNVNQLSEIISAPGTSCRHHIEDGTGRKVMHPVEVLWDAVLK